MTAYDKTLLVLGAYFVLSVPVGMLAGRCIRAANRDVPDLKSDPIEDPQPARLARKMLPSG